MLLRAAIIAVFVCGAACAAFGGMMPPDYGFQWATITHPGNAPYKGPFSFVGRVDYTYRISKTEMSAADWTPFANANLRIGDPWNTAREAYFGQMLDIGPGGVLRPRIDIPAGDRLNLGSVTWYDAARYCNWLHNGKAETREAMEYGAYDLRGFPPNPSPVTPPTRLPGATFFLPTDDEWVKAVHFDPNRYGADQPGYWDYPYASDALPIPGPVGVGTTNAGYYDFDDPFLSYRVGAYSYASTPWGLLDASGGVSEWLEEESPFTNGDHITEGTASFESLGYPFLDHAGFRGSEYPDARRFSLGFRVASVPGPNAALPIAVVGCWWKIRSSRRRDS